MAMSTNETTVNNTPVKNNTTIIDLDRTPNNNCPIPSLNTASTIKNEQDLGINDINGYNEVNENTNNSNNDHKSLDLTNNSQEQQQNKNILVENLNIIDNNKHHVNDLEDVSNMYNKMLIDNTNINKEVQINNNHNTITNNECASILN
jgi:hypothetical protein